MNSRLLIDAIVRQSMVLIAQLSTVDGARSPLTHVADEVFVNLVRELESQGLGKKIIADMFGLALRSYRQKVQRLSESVTTRGVTLWGAIHGYLAERDSAKRSEVLERFKYDEERTVRSILNDLVESGLVLGVGRGLDKRYRVATPEELEDLGMLSSGDVPETSQNLVWLHVCREGPLSREQLVEILPLDGSTIDEALQQLVNQDRVTLVKTAPEEKYTTEQCIIRVGESAGWEASVIDHHRAVMTALAAKLVTGPHASAAQDEVGGTTLSFDMWKGHPHEGEVRQLLADTRRRVITLWEAVEGHNEMNPIHAHKAEYNLTFYCGQYLTDEEDM